MERGVYCEGGWGNLGCDETIVYFASGSGCTAAFVKRAELYIKKGQFYRL